MNVLELKKQRLINLIKLSDNKKIDSIYKNDFQNDFFSTASSKELYMLDLALEDVEKGRLITHEEFIKDREKYLNKKR